MAARSSPPPSSSAPRKRCIARTLAVYREPPALRRLPISAVAASCFWHSLIGVDEKNRPLTPVYTWADSRCRADAAALATELGERAIHARTGCMLRASYWPAKLAWLRRVDRRLFASVRRWMSPAEWLYREFTGHAQCGLSMASGTGLLNAHTLAWDERAARPLPSHPGPSQRSHGGARRLRPAPPRLSPAGRRPLVSRPRRRRRQQSRLRRHPARPRRHQCRHQRRPARHARRARSRPFPFGLFCYRVDAERHLIGGAVSNAGNLRAWCLRELRLDDSQIERQLAARPLPAHGLTVLPFWSAERAPTWDEDRRGRIDGLTFSTTALDILQALTEASYYRIALIADLIVKQERSRPRFIVSGGIQHSPSSLRRLANILNRPIYPNAEPEASIRGAAIYALEREGAAIAPLRLGRPSAPSRPPPPLIRRSAPAMRSRGRVLRLRAAVRPICDTLRDASETDGVHSDRP